MRPLFLATLLLTGCTGPASDDEPTDTADADTDTDADTDADTDTDTVPDVDRDGDGYESGTDCDDTRDDVHPGVAADVCNGRDDDCDQVIDEDPDLNWYLDTDHDGFGKAGSSSFVACEPGSDVYASNSADCDDEDETVFPGADERCDGEDNDCDGAVDDDVIYGTYFPDVDGDGFGDALATPVETCAPDAGYVTDGTDCDDTSESVSPIGYETCDGIDNDCNGEKDENEAEWIAFWLDADGDGAGVETAVYGCDAESAGGVTNTYDCDDANPGEPVFVDAAGSPRGTGRIDDPLSSIQSAIDLASTCVKVSAGEYHEDLDFYGNNITVESIDGSAATTINGTGYTSTVTFTSGETSAATLRGFTVTGGNGTPSTWSGSYWTGSYYYYYTYYYTYGGGLYVYYSSPTLEDLVITDNRVSYDGSYCPSSTECWYYGGSGGGLYMIGGDTILTDVDIVANYGSNGAAVYQNYGSITGTRVRSHENDSDYYSWYVYGGTLDLENFEQNADTSAYGMSGMWLEYSTAAFQNASIVSTDYGVYCSESSVMVSSSVVTGATYGLYDASRSGGTWALRFNDINGNGYDYYNVYDVTGVDGNISVDPAFTSYVDDTDADTDDLTPSSRSPLVDAGDSDGIYDDVDGSRNDIGAYGGPEGSGW